MHTNNGKLVAQECDHSGVNQQKNEDLMKQYQNLELQIATISQRQDAIHLEEANTVKSCLQKLETKLIGLENTVSKYLTQFLFINICGVIGLFALQLGLGNYHQSNNCQSKVEKSSKSIELYHLSSK